MYSAGTPEVSQCPRHRTIDCHTKTALDNLAHLARKPGSPKSISAILRYLASQRARGVAARQSLLLAAAEAHNVDRGSAPGLPHAGRHQQGQRRGPSPEHQESAQRPGAQGDFRVRRCADSVRRPGRDQILELLRLRARVSELLGVQGQPVPRASGDRLPAALLQHRTLLRAGAVRGPVHGGVRREVHQGVRGDRRGVHDSRAGVVRCGVRRVVRVPGELQQHRGRTARRTTPPSQPGRSCGRRSALVAPPRGCVRRTPICP